MVNMSEEYTYYIIRTMYKRSDILWRALSHGHVVNCKCTCLDKIDYKNLKKYYTSEFLPCEAFNKVYEAYFGMKYVYESVGEYYQEVPVNDYKTFLYNWKKVGADGYVQGYVWQDSEGNQFWTNNDTEETLIHRMA